MKKLKLKFNLIATLFAVILLFSTVFAPAAFAANGNLTDNAGILSEEDFEYVKSYIESISEERSFDIVIVTTNGYEQENITAFADDFFDYNGYGYGDGRDGIIFAIDMLGREFVLTTSGSGIDAVTDYGEEYIYDNMQEDIKAGEFRRAFTAGFADSVVYLLEAYNSGNVYDVERGADASKANYATMAATSLLIGLMFGLISSMKHKNALKTVRRQFMADSYERKDSMTLTAEKDIYLYTNVVVRPKPEKKKDSGGGTSVHTSSSGRSHGGGHSRGF